MTPSSALGRKLQRLTSVGLSSTAVRPAAEVAPPPPPVGDSSPTPLAAALELAARPQPEQSAPLGAQRTTAHGPLHVTARSFHGGHRHGRIAVSSALAVEPSHVAALALDETFADVSLERALLLDTETTGLAGGAGTLPFLIGLGRFQSGTLELEQLFLARPGEERPMLALLAERLAEASCVVSFNGKSYDWPLLRTRFVLNRLPVPAPPPHLDLLHCARRAFRHRGGTARLGELEAEVLGHRRVGDIPGHLIPALYFSYLRNRGAGALHRVLDHNAQDLLALTALLGHLGQCFSGPAEAIDQRDALGLAEVAMRAGHDARAEALAAAASRCTRPHIASAAHVVRARARWRARDVAGAAEQLERAVALSRPPESAGLHLALCKLYEHRLRDLLQAQRHAQLSAGAEPRQRAELRRARLERKLRSYGTSSSDG